MSGKYLIFGATGSIGSNLSKMMAESNHDVQLIGRDEESLKSISADTGCKYTVVDVLNSSKIESLKNEFANEEIRGIAYCVGSIDLKPLRMVKKDDFQKCFDLNFYPIIETIKRIQRTAKLKVKKISTIKY